MGARGPAPQPTALRVLHGARPARINRNEPEPVDSPPIAPAWLSPPARDEWNRVAPDLITMRIAKRIDSNQLAAYCEAVVRFQVATALVHRSGPLLVTADGDVKRNPAVAQARDAAAEMHRWAREFGMTPSARQPMRVEHTVVDSGERSLAEILASR